MVTPYQICCNSSIIVQVIILIPSCYGVDKSASSEQDGTIDYKSYNSLGGNTHREYRI